MTLSDPTAQIVAEILTTLGQMQAEERVDETVAQGISQGLQDLSAELTSPNRSRAGTWSSAHSFNLAAAARTQDLELLSSQSNVGKFVGALPLQPIVVTDPISITLTPVGNPVLTWTASGAGRMAFADGILIKTRWDLTVAANPTERIWVVLPATFIVQDQPTIGLALTGAPSFAKADVNETPYDPFVNVPIANQSDLRKRMWDKIQNAVASVSKALPSFQTPVISLQPSPHTFSIGRTLSFIDRQKAKRRGFIALWDYIPPHDDQAIRVSKAYIEPIIRQKMANIPGLPDPVSLLSLEFKDWGIVIKIYMKHEETVVVINITVEVWMTYELNLRNDTATHLFIEALNHDSTGAPRWRYQYDIENCWPICGKVEDEVRKQTEDNIAKNQLQTFDFGDLSAFARAARGRFDSYGLLIYMVSR